MDEYFTHTENGATQLTTSGNRVLDLFSEVGSARKIAQQNPEILHDMFANAIAENPEQAMSLMFWVRAARIGAGERDVFDVLFGFAYKNFPEFILDNFALIGNLGYYRDYVRIAERFPELEGRVVEIFAEGLRKESHLIAKWLPRRTRLYSLVREKLNLNNGDFRRLVGKLSDCVEQKICANKIGEIDYSKIPSKAFNNYRQMFLAKDRERFIKSLVEQKINMSVVYPHEVFSIYWNDESRLDLSFDDVKLIIDAQWKNLNNFISDKMRFATLLDTSGSMRFGGAEKTAFPLALYVSEHQEGLFKNKLISFSSNAQFFDLENFESVVDKYLFLRKNSIVDNTNIASVFELLLETAKANNIAKDKMPNCLLILSDMQFDEGTEYDITLIDKLKLDYKYAGYDFPSIIYWNLDATNTGIIDDKKSNAAFISGFNPKIMKSVFAGMSFDDDKNTSDLSEAKSLTIDPIKVMTNALEPIMKNLNFENLTKLPQSFCKFDYNKTRGYSTRMRRPRKSLAKIA